MITKDALEYLADNFASRMIFDDYTSHAVAAALPKGVELHCLERFQTTRNRFRGTFATSSVEAFVGYVSHKACGGDEQEPPSVPCFVDAERMSATAIFNLGTEAAPGHGDDRAVLTMKRTAAFDALLALSGKPLGQQAFVDWLEDWLPHVAFTGADEVLISPATAIAAVRAVTIDTKRTAEHKVDPMAASRSTFEQVEAKSRGGLPQGFAFHCEPYSGLDERKIRVRLGIRTSGDAPAFVATIVGAEALSESLAQELVHVLEGHFAGEPVDPLVGTFQQGA